VKYILICESAFAYIVFSRGGFPRAGPPLLLTPPGFFLFLQVPPILDWGKTGTDDMAATLKQIAQKTGFSLPTVHQILNGYDVPFAEATRKKVLAAALEMNYKPNITARSLVKRRSMLLGVLYNGVNHPLVADFMRGVQASVTARQYVPVLLTHTNAAEETDNLRTVVDRGVDGLLVNLSVDPEVVVNAEKMAEVYASGKPMVEIFGRFAPGVPNVTLDFEASAVLATRKLIEEGHRSIILLVRHFPDNAKSQALHWAPEDFTRGYEATLEAVGLEKLILRYAIDPDMTKPYFNFQGAYETAGQLFTHPSKPTAVICYSRSAAEAVMVYCDRHEDRVPKDFVIVTFGASRPEVASKYRLVHWSMPTEEVGKLAAQMVFDQIDGKPTTSVQLAPKPM
jgi:LacI family transcriptional regulator